MRRSLSQAYNTVKYLKIGIYELYALAMLMFASGLRIALAALNWPPTNADEGTMGIMALHIAYRGEHPFLFYGQNYMGSLEAYLGAFYFHLLSGPSLFALRLGVITLTTLFFLSTYLLASLLYSKQLALVTLALLSLGSIPVFTREMIATGGSTQTLLFGSLAFLLAAKLSLTNRPGTTLRTGFVRFIGYSLWGFVLGLGVWSDMVVLPFFAMAALLLLVCCWSELLRWAWPAVLVSFLVGAWPLIEYNRQTAPGQDTLTILLGLFHGSTVQAPHTLHGILHGIAGTLLVSIPTATGSPFCPVMELPWLGDNSPHSFACTVAHASWGTGYLALLGVALSVTMRALWMLRQGGRSPNMIRSTARLALLGGAVLAIVVYATSSGPQGWPGFHARYLVGLLIVTPAILAPLWNAACAINSQRTRLERITGNASRVVFATITIMFLIGMGMLLSEVPAAQTSYQRQTDLIAQIEHHGITHFYTDYWSCDQLVFLSDEHIICVVVDNNLQPSHNRDPRYISLVQSDPHAAYVFPLHIAQLAAVELKVALAPGTYRRFVVDGDVVYQQQSSAAATRQILRLR
jgi:hypothetical protein